MHYIICRCGLALGLVDNSTKGLCPTCGRSIWLQHASAHFSAEDSIELARDLNGAGALTCKHERSSCYSLCGVEYNPTELRWFSISRDRREYWFTKTINAGIGT
jgi:hypothetical protein